MKKKKDHLSPGPSPFRRGEENKKILNRGRKKRAEIPLTRAFGAASPATKRARQIIGGAETRHPNTALEADPHPSAGSGQALRSSPLRGEGKIGEEKIGEGIEKDPVRVPLAEVPGGSWKIKRMPPDLKQKLDKLLSDGTFHSCRQLAKWLGDNGFEISHAAIHKYGQKFERRLDAVRMATEQARIVCEQYRGDDTQMQSALMRLVQTQLFEVLTASNEIGQGSAIEKEGATVATIAPVNITALARSVSGLARAETEHRRWAERARAGVAEAEKKVDEAQAKGLSKDAAAQIKAVLLEI